MAAEERLVTRDSFKRLAAIVSHTAIPAPTRLWSAEEWAIIRAGHAPFDFDDKWIAFVERDRLFLHRSWTTRGVYEARFTKNGEHWRITEAVVEGDPTSYRRASDETESLGLELIIESVLLQRFHERKWHTWQAMMERELSVAGLPPGKLYVDEAEVLMDRDGRWVNVQEPQEFEFGVWLHICIGNRWGRPVFDVE